MRSDSQLQQDVIDELRFDPATKDCEIGVAAKDGVVTLSGTVSSFAQKRAAEAAAGRVANVRAVAEDLTVTLSAAHERSDTELAHAALNALTWDVDVPDTKIQLRVEHGWITMDGHVRWHFQRAAAERAVRSLIGVRGITNRVTIEATPASADDVTRKIRAALHRTADREAARIHVEAHDGKVTLTGAVRSWAERADIEYAVWSAPGVVALDDRIHVGV